MKVSSRSSGKHVLWLFVLLLLPASAFSNKAQESQNAKQANEMWEQAIAAKGGREQVNQGVSYPDEGLTQVQYLYLMETRWVKPIPISVTKDSIGLKKFDVLQTRLEDKRVDYFLDRKTHLPARVEVFYGGSDRATLTVDLSEYVTVSGIQMPGKQKRGRINFQINPTYDEGIFSRPPSIEAGPKAWQRTIKPSS